VKSVLLGKTGLEVSRVGIGGIPLNRPSEKEAIKVVQRALDLGVNFIDTANGYACFNLITLFRTQVLKKSSLSSSRINLQKKSFHPPFLFLFQVFHCFLDEQPGYFAFVFTL
jgi:predicted aldo/keto reductase-like oxidoreductase